ncbi:MAG: hydantoinase B/oxoprolinase family protein [Pseudomonadota bacterium]
MTDRFDTITGQVLWNRLLAIVEEQAQSLIRTAFSTSVREAGDLSVGIYDAAGQMLAQAVTGTPGHVNSMAAAVRHFIAAFAESELHEGDVLITNDPWLGTGHLHDITVVTPLFHANAGIGFVACTAHVVDIGGRGFNAEAHSVFEEGFRIPIMKLVSRGQMNDSLIALLRTNVREPDQVVGDVYALVACNRVGIQRIQGVLSEYELDDLRNISDYILIRSREATEAAIRDLPNGQATAIMTIDGYTQAIKLCANVEIDGNSVTCDFGGSSAVDGNGINVPLVYTQAYACYALKCAIAPEVPNNHASLAPFVVTAPPGTIVNAQHPAPVALRHTVGQMLPDAIFGALDQLLPDRLPAEGAGTLCNFQVSVRDRESGHDASAREVLVFNSGGTGARPEDDGLSATAFPSGVMAMPVEASEQAGAVVIWQKELLRDSGGHGMYRGGLGQRLEIGVESDCRYVFSAMFDRVRFPARGRAGGESGGATQLVTSESDVLPGKCKLSLEPDVTVDMRFAGGGGYGDPLARRREAVMNDLLQDYISERAAREVYALSETDINAVNQARLSGRPLATTRR